MNEQEKPSLKVYNISSPDWYEFQLRTALGISKDQDPLLVAIHEVRAKLVVLFAGKEAEFEKLLTDLSSRKYTSAKELIRIFAENISKFAQSNFSLEELERRSRVPEHFREDQIRLNELLFFNIGRNDPTKIKIHVFPSTTLSIEEKIKQFREGLKELAKLLKNDSRFVGVKTIMAKSWIVSKNPGIFGRLGFQILEENEKDRILEVRRAVISCEDFKKKYL